MDGNRAKTVEPVYAAPSAPEESKVKGAPAPLTLPSYVLMFHDLFSWLSFHNVWCNCWPYTDETAARDDGWEPVAYPVADGGSDSLTLDCSAPTFSCRRLSLNHYDCIMPMAQQGRELSGLCRVRQGTGECVAVVRHQPLNPLLAS